MYYDLDSNERANKAALLLAHDRYAEQFAAFVKGSSRRLAYVQDKVDELLEACAAETGGDPGYVKDRFAMFLRESVPSKLPEDSYKIKNEPSIEDLNKTDIMEHGEVEGAGTEEALSVDEKIDLGEYTLPENQLMPEGFDSVAKCVRCGNEVESKIAKRSAACVKCTLELRALALRKNAYGDDLAFTGDDMYDMYGDNGPDEDDMAALNHMWDKDMYGRMEELKRRIEFTDDPDERRDLFEQLGELQWKLDRTNTRGMSPDQEDDYYEQPSYLDDIRDAKTADMAWSNPGTNVQPNYSDPSNGLASPTDPNMTYTCTICGQTGTKDEITNHVNQAHADVLQRMQQEHQQMQSVPSQYPTASKEADVTDGTNPAVVPPLQETPGDHFDDIVNDLAAQAAARHFSIPTDEQVHSIASQLGLPADEVKNSLVAVATFGNYTGVNGQLGGDGTPPQGYEAIQMQSGNNSTQQAKVPTNLVVQKVAEDMNLETDLAYSMIRDKYGADLPETYHAQVQGQQTFYLPSQMAAAQDQQQQQQQQMEQQAVDPNVGPAFQQTPPGAPVQQAQPGQTPQQ